MSPPGVLAGPPETHDARNVESVLSAFLVRTASQTVLGPGECPVLSVPIWQRQQVLCKSRIPGWICGHHGLACRNLVHLSGLGLFVSVIGCEVCMSGQVGDLGDRDAGLDHRCGMVCLFLQNPYHLDLARSHCRGMTSLCQESEGPRT